MHYLYGALFENLVIGEIIKSQAHSGKRPSVYYWRESNGTEIDCIMEKSWNELTAIEIKSGQTFNIDYLRNLELFPVSKDQANIRKILVYNGQKSLTIKDVRISSWEDFTGNILNPPVIPEVGPDYNT